MNRAEGREQRAEESQHAVLSTKYTEAGFISIFTVLIIMGILTLITIGFSGITRQAQRRTLDNQLNASAFYAAESGVNDAKAALLANPAYTKPTCAYSATDLLYFRTTIDSATNLSYTCVLVSNVLSDMVFSSIPVEGTASPKTLNLETASGNAITTLDITWDDATNPGSTAIPTTPSGGYPNILPPASTYGNNLGVLRVDMVPIDGALDRATLQSRTHTFFLVPSKSASASSVVPQDDKEGLTSQGDLKWIKCSGATSPCSVTIRLLNAAGSAATSHKYLVRLQSLYNPLKATVNNVKSSVGSESLINGQAVVDVTGKANDVLRRIQVRLPLSLNGQTSAFALQSADSICKILLVKQPPASTGLDASGSGDPACAIN